MSRFGPDPKSFFDKVYEEVPPWDVGGPQPALVALLRDFPASGPALDAGCGSGDHVLFLAQLGLDVLGIDFVEEAIAQARAKAARQTLEIARRIEFRVADALRPSALGRTFGAVIDTGFYHLFDEEVCERYVAELGAVVRPGGRVYLLAFATEFPVANVPRKITEEELRGRFSPSRGWEIKAVRSAEFLSRVAKVPAVAACIEKR